MKKERWADVRGFEGLYHVSDQGRVHGLKTGKLRTPVPDKDGYLTLVLYKNNRPTSVKIHRLVATAFVANPEGLPEVDHEDRDRKNNKYSNLKWVTRNYNATRSVKASREKHGHAKLTSKKVARMRAEREQGVTFGFLASKYGVSRATVYDAVTGRTWGAV